MKESQLEEEILRLKTGMLESLYRIYKGYDLDENSVTNSPDIGVAYVILVQTLGYDPYEMVDPVTGYILPNMER